MKFAIETDGLSKSFGNVKAISDINLRVKSGEIFGFLGLNGAGKTTTIRALLGMIRPTAGTIKLLGQVVGTNGRGPWRQVGHMVETPTAYPELTVTENLEIARRLQGISDKNAAIHVIERLGLSPYANRKAGKLSTGNLQRLGLARALLHRPQLLILDEPTNGLDPAGMVEIRELLKKLVENAGITIFLSSHILTEVNRLATRIGIIHHGRLLKELGVNKLRELRSRQLIVTARKIEAAQKVLTQAGFAVQVKEQKLCLRDEDAINAPEQVATILVNAGTPPTSLTLEQENLEKYFLRLTGANQ